MSLLNRSKISLLKAIDIGSLKDVRRLLDRGVNPNFSYRRSIPIIEAAKKDNYEILIALINAGADVNVQSDLGFTPLMNATITNKINNVRILLQSGARVNLMNFTGKTALYQAIIG